MLKWLGFVGFKMCVSYSTWNVKRRCMMSFAFYSTVSLDFGRSLNFQSESIELNQHTLWLRNNDMETTVSVHSLCIPYLP